MFDKWKRRKKVKNIYNVAFEDLPALMIDNGLTVVRTKLELNQGGTMPLSVVLTLTVVEGEHARPNVIRCQVGMQPLIEVIAFISPYMSDEASVVTIPMVSHDTLLQVAKERQARLATGRHRGR